MAGENDDKDKLWIKLHLYDTDMSVSINRNSGEEEFYRKAAKLITDLVNIYASRFKTKRSEKDILYMALLDIALRYEKELGRNDVEPYQKIINQLTSEIEDSLKK